MHQCQNCPRPAPEHAFLCGDCTRTFLTVYTRAKELIPMLDQPRTGIPEHRSGSGAPAMPINPKTIELRDSLIRQLRDLPGITTQDAYLPYRELEDTVRAATRAVDIPPERVIVEFCSNEGCDGRYIGDPRSSRARCDKCGEIRHDAISLRARRLSQVRDALPDMPIRNTCEFLNSIGVKLNYSTARKWIERGKIQKNPDGTVSIGNVLDAMNQKATAHNG